MDIKEEDRHTCNQCISAGFTVAIDIFIAELLQTSFNNERGRMLHGLLPETLGEAT